MEAKYRPLSSAKSRSSTDSSRSLLDNEPDRPYQTPNSERRQWAFAFAIHATILTISVFFFMMGRVTAPGIAPHKCGFDAQSPVSSAVTYESRKLDAGPGRGKIQSPYFGAPRKELDDAWEDLLENANVAIPEDTTLGSGQYGENNVKTPGGSGDIAMLSMYYQLHCLKYIHNSMHASHYFPSQTAQQRSDTEAETDVCLDVLRQAVQCHGDTTLLTYKWDKSRGAPRLDPSAPHTCRSFGEIDSWARHHRVSKAKAEQLALDSALFAGAGRA